MKVLGVIIAMVAMVMSIEPSIDIEPATSNTLVVDEGNGTSGSMYLKRPEQIKLMGECVEDAIAVGQFWYKKYEAENELAHDEQNEKRLSFNPEIAVAFFNYRTEGKP